jgi:hypothetical protein
MSNRKPKAHYYRFPTKGLFTDYGRVEETELNVLRAARAFLTFQGLTTGRVIGLAGAWPMVPFNLITEVLPHWHRHSTVTQQRFGVSRMEQLRQCIRLALNDGPSPQGYYLAGIAEHRNGPQLQHYIHDLLHETAIEFCRFSVEKLHGVQPQLDDKQSLEILCRENSFPAIRTFLRIDGKLEGSDDDFRLAAGQSSLFVKPASGMQGQNAMRWNKEGDRYVNSAGQSCGSFDALMLRLREQSSGLGRELLVQTAATNRMDIRAFAGRALSTVRLVTLRTSQGDIFPVQAGWRVASDENAAVDNYHAGGIYFHADYRSGKVGTGTSMSFPADPCYLNSAPLTGKRLTEETVPGWNALISLAIQLHSSLTRHTICGWDLALTDNGPIVVECNSVPGMPAPRQRPFGGFLETEYASRLIKEISVFLRTLCPPRSRFRFRDVETTPQKTPAGT